MGGKNLFYAREQSVVWWQKQRQCFLGKFRSGERKRGREMSPPVCLVLPSSSLRSPSSSSGKEDRRGGSGRPERVRREEREKPLTFLFVFFSPSPCVPFSLFSPSSALSPHSHSSPTFVLTSFPSIRFCFFSFFLIGGLKNLSFFPSFFLR